MNASITKFNLEIAIKEKYFEAWSESEKEKDRLKTSKLVFNSFHQKLAKEHNPTISPEILQIDPGLLVLQDVEGIALEPSFGRKLDLL